MVNTNKLKARILEMGLTQELIAKDIKMDYSTFNLKINNKRRIYVDEIAKLCRVLNITTPAELQDFFGLDFLTVSTTCENDTNETVGGA